MKKRGIILAAIIMSAFATGCGKSDRNSNSSKKVTQLEITTAPASPTSTEPETEITTDVSDLLDGDWTLCSKSGREFASISFSPEDSKLVLNDDDLRRDEYDFNWNFSIDNDKIKINLMDNNGSYDYTILDEDKKLIYINDFSDERFHYYLRQGIGADLYRFVNHSVIEIRNEFHELGLDDSSYVMTPCIFSNDESKNSFKNSGLLSYFNLSMEDFEDMFNNFVDGMSYDEIKNNYAFFVQIEENNNCYVYVAEDRNSTEWACFSPQYQNFSYPEKVIIYGETFETTTSDDMTLEEVYEKATESGYWE